MVGGAGVAGLLIRFIGREILFSAGIELIFRFAHDHLSDRGGSLGPAATARRPPP